MTKGRDFELLRVANCGTVHKRRRVRGAKATLVGFVLEVPLGLSLGWKSLERVVSGDEREGQELFSCVLLFNCLQLRTVGVMCSEPRGILPSSYNVASLS